MPNGDYNGKILGQIKAVFVGNRDFVLILLLAVLSLMVSYFYIGYVPVLEKDAISYSEAANFLRGEPVGEKVPMNRVLTTPLFLYSTIFLDLFFNNFIWSVSIFNLIFFFLCLAAFYLLAREIYPEKGVAFFGSLLFAANYYLIDPGNSHLADIGGWFFFIFSTFLAVKYFNSQNRKFYYLAIIFAAFGFLFKEYGGLGIISLGLLVLFSSATLKQKIKDIALAGCLFLIPFLSYHLFVYFQYHYSYFDWYQSIKALSTEAGRQASGFSLLVKVVGWVFSIGWLVWLWGVRAEWQTKDRQRWKVLLAILPASLAFVIWPEVAQRLAFILVPWLALIAGFGLFKMNRYWAYSLVGAYILFNYNIKYLLDIINLPF